MVSLMTTLFFDERVKLQPPGVAKWPHLANLEGRMIDERRHPLYGRCMVVRFPRFGDGPPYQWIYAAHDDVTSVEGQARLPATVRAISLWQPYASLVAWGEKQYETRHWSTHYRGLLAIHAAKRQPTKAEVEALSYRLNPIVRKLTRNPVEHYLFNELPYGAVLCIVNLVDVVSTQQVRVSTKERDLGNYAPGRCAWKMELVEVFPKPIPAKGAQGFWNWARP